MTGGRVVIIGPVGRNVAAGMSGGVAYVLNNDGTLEAKLNREMVDLQELDDEGDATVREMLAKHVEMTGSPVAEKVLASWSAYKGLFVQIMPRDYARVLEAQKRAHEQGLDVDAAVMEVARG
jgi:glutamate synthase domain-containing protein 3